MHLRVVAFYRQRSLICFLMLVTEVGLCAIVLLKRGELQSRFLFLAKGVLGRFLCGIKARRMEVMLSLFELKG